VSGPYKLFAVFVHQTWPIRFGFGQIAFGIFVEIASGSFAVLEK
jgi:hypothetical protein